MSDHHSARHLLFDEVLRQGFALRVSVTGVSMRPLIESGAIVTLQPTRPETIGRGDLIFFRNHAGHLILHRVMKKRRTPEGWVFHTKGDARRGGDAPIADTSVLGKASQLQHPNSRVCWNFESPGWRLLNWSIGLAHRLHFPMGRVTALLKKAFGA